MQLKTRHWILLAACAALLAMLVFSCNADQNTGEEPSPFKSLSDMGFAGKSQCASCHQDKFETYIQTAMGKSFESAHKGKSIANFEAGNVVYDSFLQLYYQAFLRGDSIWIKEFRILADDTIHQRVEKISHIIGSGHHTNSHFVQFGQFVYQAPITYYSQKGKWDLAPGFENGANSRFSRPIGLECMTCHNAMPEFEPQSINAFQTIQNGIDCESCHGPGKDHIKNRLAQKAVDGDILNPTILDKQASLDMCQRCHLQGVAVLREGIDFQDWQPGSKLSDFAHVFLPDYQGEQDDFIMASQAQRLRLSECFKNSSKLTCVSCHDPHQPLKEATQRVQGACIDCHNGGDDCPEPKALSQDCANCHMPKSGAIDIPHISITDHKIQVPTRDNRKKYSQEDLKDVKDYLHQLEDQGNAFRSLKNYALRDGDTESSTDRAKGFLRFYEAFNTRAQFLDSVEAYLGPFGNAQEETPVHLALQFYRNNFGALVEMGEDLSAEALDAWSLYRLGEAHLQLGKTSKAKAYLNRALSKKPLILEFKQKLGVAHFRLGEFESAKQQFEEILKRNNRFSPAWMNLAFLNQKLGDFSTAEKQYQRAIQLNPNYQLAYENLFLLYKQQGKSQEAKNLLKSFLPFSQEKEVLRDLLKSLRSL